MAWLQPKTDWKESYDADGKYTGDYFNVEDYNRIKNNIIELRTMSIQLVPEYSFPKYIIDIDTESDKEYDDYPYADEINALTGRLEAIMENTFTTAIAHNAWTREFSIGTRTMYYDNSPFIGFADLNRIENACLRIYNTITAQHNSRRRLAFYLGRKERF